MFQQVVHRIVSLEFTMFLNKKLFPKKNITSSSGNSCVRHEQKTEPLWNYILAADTTANKKRKTILNNNFLSVVWMFEKKITERQEMENKNHKYPHPNYSVTFFTFSKHFPLFILYLAEKNVIRMPLRKLSRKWQISSGLLCHCLITRIFNFISN